MKSSSLSSSILLAALCLFVGSYVITVQCKEIPTGTIKGVTVDSLAENVDNDHHNVPITSNEPQTTMFADESMMKQSTNTTTPSPPPQTTTTEPTTTAPTTKADNTTTTTTTTTSTTEKTTTSSTTKATTSTSTTSTTTPAPITTSTTSLPPILPCHRFDGPSFMGGIVLTLGLLAIGMVAYKFYKAHNERNYQTL